MNSIKSKYSSQKIHILKNESGKNDIVIMSYDKYKNLKEETKKQEKKVETLLGIRDAFREMKKGKEKMQSFEDFLNEIRS